MDTSYRPGLVKYDAATGRVLETADFVPNSCDPHGLAMHDGALISCDARYPSRLDSERTPDERLDLPDRFCLSVMAHVGQR